MPRSTLVIIIAFCWSFLCFASAQTPQPRPRPTPSAPPPVLAPMDMRPDLAISGEGITVSWSHPHELPGWGHEGEQFSLRPGDGSIVPIPADRTLMICFRLVNNGRSESGPFSVAGTGVTNRPAVLNYDSGVGPGENVLPCLRFITPTTLGIRTASIRIDAQQTVSELREDNNAVNVRLRITPTPDH